MDNMSDLELLENFIEIVKEGSERTQLLEELEKVKENFIPLPSFNAINSSFEFCNDSTLRDRLTDLEEEFLTINKNDYEANERFLEKWEAHFDAVQSAPIELYKNYVEFHTTINKRLRKIEEFYATPYFERPICGMIWCQGSISGPYETYCNTHKFFDEPIKKGRKRKQKEIKKYIYIEDVKEKEIGKIHCAPYIIN